MFNKLISFFIVANLLLFLVSCGKDHHGAGPRIPYQDENHSTSAPDKEPVENNLQLKKKRQKNAEPII